MSAEDDIFDAVTRHQIFVLRYARGREKEAEGFIARTMQEVVSRLENADITPTARDRLQRQGRDLYAYLVESGGEYAESLKDDLRQFGEYEAEFNASMIGNSVNVGLDLPAPVQIQQAAFGSFMGIEPSKGYTLTSMIDEFGPANAEMVANQIRESIVLGDTTDDLVGRIRGIIPTQQRKAATLARTAVNHVASQSRKEVMKENDDVVMGYKWVSTLDGRTSLICMSRDGVIYKDFDNDPKPPAHFNCRSTITPKVNPQFDLGADIVGSRPSVGDSGAKKVRGGITYGQWLKRQPKSFQDKALGKARADLFRSGATLDKFVDSRGNVLTLNQLAALDAEFNGGQIPLGADI